MAPFNNIARSCNKAQEHLGDLAAESQEKGNVRGRALRRFGSLRVFNGSVSFNCFYAIADDDEATATAAGDR